MLGNVLQVLGNMLQVIIAIGLLIFVHELGHFLVARKRGVKVEVFSLGFGPRLFWFKRGDTEYRISAFPVGGYVKMAGQDPEEKLTGEPYEYLSQPWWSRSLICLAGPAINYLFAFVVITLLFTIGVKIPVHESKIGSVQEESLADAAGLKAGDMIVSVEGVPVKDWDDVEDALHEFADKKIISIGVKRNEKMIEIQLGIKAGEDLGIRFFVSPIVGSVMEGYPAHKAGLQQGDEILAIEGKDIRSWTDITPAIKANPDRILTFKIGRGDKTFERKMFPKDQKIGIVAYTEYKIKKLNLGRSANLSLRNVTGMTSDFFDSIWKLITRQTTLKESAGGPIMVFAVTYEGAKRGLSELFYWISAISVMLALINIMPFPVLDGGNIVLYLIEAVRRKRLPTRTYLLIQQIGAVFLFALIIYITYNDIMRYHDKIKGFFGF